MGCFGFSQFRDVVPMTASDEELDSILAGSGRISARPSIKLLASSPPPSLAHEVTSPEFLQARASTKKNPPRSISSTSSFSSPDSSFRARPSTLEGSVGLKNTRLPSIHIKHPERKGSKKSYSSKEVSQNQSSKERMSESQKSFHDSQKNMDSVNHTNPASVPNSTPMIAGIPSSIPNVNPNPTIVESGLDPDTTSGSVYMNTTDRSTKHDALEVIPEPLALPSRRRSSISMVELGAIGSADANSSLNFAMFNALKAKRVSIDRKEPIVTAVSNEVSSNSVSNSSNDKSVQPHSTYSTTTKEKAVADSTASFDVGSQPGQSIPSAVGSGIMTSASSKVNSSTDSDPPKQRLSLDVNGRFFRRPSSKSIKNLQKHGENIPPSPIDASMPTGYWNSFSRPSQSSSRSPVAPEPEKSFNNLSALDKSTTGLTTTNGEKSASVLPTDKSLAALNTDEEVPSKQRRESLGIQQKEHRRPSLFAGISFSPSAGSVTESNGSRRTSVLSMDKTRRTSMDQDAKAREMKKKLVATNKKLANELEDLKFEKLVATIPKVISYYELDVAE